MTSARLSLGEGDTPVIQLPSVAARCGVAEVWAKAEWMNPTGSYKDRIAAATMATAIARGRRGWVGTSSGNGGAASTTVGEVLRRKSGGLPDLVHTHPSETIAEAVRPCVISTAKSWRSSRPK